MSVFTTDRNIKNLAPEMIPRVEKFLEECKKKGHKIKISEGKRSKARQLYLYSFGRYIDKPLELRYLGLDHPDVYSRPKELKLTWTLESNHLTGNAIDIFFDKPGDIYNGLWEDVYDIAEECGLKSLWREKGVDKPHLEFNPDWKEHDHLEEWQKELFIWASESIKDMKRLLDGDIWSIMALIHRNLKK